MAVVGLKRKLSDMTIHQCIHFRAANPHKEGSAPYQRYETYKQARDLQQFIALNPSAKHRCKDWPYALDHACVTRLGLAALNISIYDRGWLVGKDLWHIDNRMSLASLISMIRHDFGFNETVVVFATNDSLVPSQQPLASIGPSQQPLASIGPSEQPLASVGIGTFQAEAFVQVVYTLGRPSQEEAEVDRAGDELESRRKDVADMAQQLECYRKDVADVAGQLERAQEMEAGASDALVSLLSRSKYQPVKEGAKDSERKRKDQPASISPPLKRRLRARAVLGARALLLSVLGSHVEEEEVG
jgi:hypothetical protein